MAEIKMDSGMFYDCPECGNEVELGDNYCQECGEPLDWKEEYNFDDEDLEEEYENRKKVYN